MVQNDTLYHKGEQEDYQMSVIAVHDEPVGRRLREGVESGGISARSCTKHNKDSAGETSRVYVAEQPEFLS